MIDEFRALLYAPMLTAHGAWRWVVVLAGALVVVTALRSLSRPADPPDAVRQASRLFVLSADIQLVLGLLLYLVLSPVSRAAFDGAQDSETMFFGVVHLLVMVLAVAVAHAGNVAVRRQTETRRAARAALTVQGTALAIMLLGTPWWRPLLRL